MELPPEPSISGDVDAAQSAAWDFGSLLDFTIDESFGIAAEDPFLFSWASSEDAPTLQNPTELSPSPSPIPTPPIDPAPPASSQALGAPQAAADGLGLGRVRKRDARLVCPNYLAGRVPCACPELDEKAAEDEEVAEILTGGRKRARPGTAAGAVARCQVHGCEADISELKGYHKRHRVCLRCANAPFVILDGEQKRYCQQCGKFHLLPDFDEGKRSCRRKLERHNNRRRRRPTDSIRSVTEKETKAQGDFSVDNKCDGELREEKIEYACDTVAEEIHNISLEGDIVFGSEDGHGSPGCSLPSLKTDQSNSNVSVAASDEAILDDQTINLRSSLSSTICVDKSTYASVCPTGRISFKLYDWNPAEFPRRLRHQIFEWLANMPVELEGYIRPGCTILTVFISMPQFMWEKVYQDTADCIRSLLNEPGSLLLGRGTILINLGNKIVQVLKDGTSLVNVKMEVQAPRLHYVYPTYFEAGKPMELVACGSNLEQPKFRFLVSFAGRYLKYDCSRVKYPGKTRYSVGSEAKHICNAEHEVFTIKIAQTDSEAFGPAFIEVENASGISNFVPIIVGSKSICSEIKRIEYAPEYCWFTNNFVYGNAISDPDLSLCEVLKLKQSALSTLLLDIAWLLKEHHVEEKKPFMNLNNVQRITSVLQFLLKNELFSIMEVIIHRLDSIINVDDVSKTENWTSNDDLTQFREFVENIRYLLHQRNMDDVKSRTSGNGVLMPQNNLTDVCTILPPIQDNEANNLCSTTSKLTEEGIHDSLLPKAITHRQRCLPRPVVKSSLGYIFPSNVTRSYFALFVMASVVMCLMACIVLLHPHAAGKFAVSVKRCMFGGPMT